MSAKNEKEPEGKPIIDELKDTIAGDKTEELTDVKDKVDEIPIESEEKPPSRPPRPLTPTSQSTKTLKDAFPSIEDKYITAVLVASQGELDPAFNALLYLSDPSFKPEIPAPRPSLPVRKSDRAKPKTQLQEDEELARRLAREFENQDHPRTRDQQRAPRRASTRYEEDEDSDDGFEQIKKEFTQGVEEAKTKLNSWVSGITKRISDSSNTAPGSTKLFGALGGTSDRNSFDTGAAQAGNFNYNRKKNTHFDEAPEVIADDVQRIQLHDNDKDAVKVPSETKQETDVYGTPKLSSDKWQPLNKVEPEPVPQDTFLVTDSDDDEDKEDKK